MDVWGPAHVSGHGRERYFLLLRERFREDLPVLRLHSDRGGEFFSDLLRDFCRGEGILQSFTLPASPQQNGIAERRIGLVINVARTSMTHAAASHFLWPFAVRYVAHQLKSWPRVSLPETSPTLRWTGEVGDASVFRSVSQVDPLRGTVPVEVAVDLGTARGVASGGAEPARAEPGGAECEGAGSECAGSGDVEPVVVEPRGAEPEGVEPRGAESEGTESGGAEPRGTASSGGPAGASPRLSPRREPLSLQQLCKWFAQRTRLQSGAAVAGGTAAGDTGAGGVGVTHLGGAGVTAGAGGTGGAAATGPRGAHTRDPAEPGGARAGGTGAGGAGAGGAGAGNTGVVDPRAGGAGAGGAVSGGTGAGGTVRPRPYFVPLLQQALGLPSSTSLTPPLLCLIERCEPKSRPALLVRTVRTGRRFRRPRPPPVPGTHTMALRPSSVPLRIPLPPPPESSLPAVPDPESDLTHP
ncbi:unnamed protein product [Closterium sp. NIES-53]